jgi:hypothetical protein
MPRVENEHRVGVIVSWQIRPDVDKPGPTKARDPQLKLADYAPRTGEDIYPPTIDGG